MKVPKVLVNSWGGFPSSRSMKWRDSEVSRNRAISCEHIMLDCVLQFQCHLSIHYFCSVNSTPNCLVAAFLNERSSFPTSKILPGGGPVSRSCSHLKVKPLKEQVPNIGTDLPTLHSSLYWFVWLRLEDLVGSLQFQTWTKSQATSDWCSTRKRMM